MNNSENIEIMSIFRTKVDRIVRNLCAGVYIVELLPYHLNAFNIFVRLIKKLNSVLGRYVFLFY